MKLTLSLIGHLGQDATTRQVNENVAISFSVASTKKYTDKNGEQKQETTWTNCTVWRKADQTKIAQYLKKGTQVYVEGEPSARSWTNSNNEAQASLDCKVEKIELLGSAQQTTTASPAPAQATSNTNSDDLPF